MVLKSIFGRNSKFRINNETFVNKINKFTTIRNYLFNKWKIGNSFYTLVTGGMLRPIKIGLFIQLLGFLIMCVVNDEINIKFIILNT